MPKIASASEKTSTTLTFFIGLTLFGVFFLTVGYYWLFQEVRAIKNISPMPSPADVQKMTVVNYDCAQKKSIQATYFTDRVEVNLSDGRSYMLLQGMSGSGVRYVNGDESVTFWNKGNTAFVEEKNTTTYKDCVEQQP